MIINWKIFIYHKSFSIGQQNDCLKQLFERNPYVLFFPLTVLNIYHIPHMFPWLLIPPFLFLSIVLWSMHLLSHTVTTIDHAWVHSMKGHQQCGGWGVWLDSKFKIVIKSLKITLNHTEWNASLGLTLHFTKKLIQLTIDLRPNQW